MRACKFVDSLTAWEAVQPLGEQLVQQLDKAAVLAAEVRLPVPGGTDVSAFRTALVRPPFQCATRLLLVDVSRLPAP